MAGESQWTGERNGVLWGDRAADWAELQECQCRPVYEAVFERLAVGAGTACLDAGCGARQASGAEAVDEAHRQALGPFRRPDGSYRIPATFRCLVARANHG